MNLEQVQLPQIKFNNLNLQVDMEKVAKMRSQVKGVSAPKPVKKLGNKISANWLFENHRYTHAGNLL